MYLCSVIQDSKTLSINQWYTFCKKLTYTQYKNTLNMNIV